MDTDLKNSILKTGTSLVVIKCKDGVVMGSDTQVTMGNMVSNKDTQKTNPLNDYLVVSWAGLVSGAQRLSKLLGAELKLKELKSNSRPTVKQAASLVANISYSQIRQPSMVPNVVDTFLGGVNEDGTTEIFHIGVDGSLTDVDDHDASGSGRTFILGLLERQYKKDITVKEGVELAIEALKSSTQRDTGSGYGIDVFTITKKGIDKVVDQEIKPEYK
jgi:proteasome beta subunit|tara:strand:- start:1014 stop:1664 length:651 start_codon:yes stop_codon:yes gene_type:complete